MSHITVIAGSFCGADRVFTGPAIQSNESVWNGLWSLVGFFLALKAQLIIFGRRRKLLLLMYTLLLSLSLSLSSTPSCLCCLACSGACFLLSVGSKNINKRGKTDIERENEIVTIGFYYAAFLTRETSCKCSPRRPDREAPACTFTYKHSICSTGLSS